MSSKNFLGIQTVKRLVEQVEQPLMLQAFRNYMRSIDGMPQDHTGGLQMGFVFPHHIQNNAELPNLFGVFCPALPMEENPVSFRSRQLMADRECPDWFKEAIQDKELNIGFRVKVSFKLKSGTGAFIKPCARDLEHAKTEYKRHLEEESKIESDLQKKMDAEDNPAQQRAAFAEMAYRLFAKKNNNTIIAFDARTYTALMLCRAGARGGHFVNLLSGAEDIYLFSEGIKKKTTTMDDEIDRAVRVIYLG